MSAPHWTSYGALLAKVHATTVTEALATSLPSEDHTHEQAASATRVLDSDLIFILGGVLAFAPVTQQQQSWFFDGYGATNLDPIRLAYYRCARALEDLAYPAAQIVDMHRSTDRERADALSIVRGVLSPTGLVNLALASVSSSSTKDTLKRLGNEFGEGVP